MLLEALREHGEVERIVVASSDKAYGAHTELPYREDFALPASYPVRRVEGGHGHDRPVLRRHLRHADRGHSAGERVRARRRELGAA